MEGRGIWIMWGLTGGVTRGAGLVQRSPASIFCLQPRTLTLRPYVVGIGAAFIDLAGIRKATFWPFLLFTFYLIHSNRPLYPNFVQKVSVKNGSKCLFTLLPLTKYSYFISHFTVISSIILFTCKWQRVTKNVVESWEIIWSTILLHSFWWYPHV